MLKLFGDQLIDQLKQLRKTEGDDDEISKLNAELKLLKHVGDQLRQGNHALARSLIGGVVNAYDGERWG